MIIVSTSGKFKVTSVQQRSRKPTAESNSRHIDLQVKVDMKKMFCFI